MAQEQFLKPPMPDVIEQWRFYLDQLDIRSNDVILDVGCNTGDTEVFLLNLYPYIREIIGLDKSEARIRLALERWGSLDDRIRFIEGDATSLPFSDNVFDKVLCIETLEWVSPPEEGVKEIYRVLKHGGLALIEHTDFDTQVFTTSDLDTNREIIHRFTDSGPDGTIGRRLKGICEKAGFSRIKPLVYVLFNESFEESSYSYKVAHMMKEWLLKEALVSQHKLELWIEDMKALSLKGEFFYSVNRYICLCTK
jgi:ubiquinone/menaquinone biosynthesis C-methylase UbiE